MDSYNVTVGNVVGFIWKAGGKSIVKICLRQSITFIDVEDMIMMKPTVEAIKPGNKFL